MRRDSEQSAGDWPQGVIRRSGFGWKADYAIANPPCTPGICRTCRPAPLSREVDNLHPIRAIADRVATGLAQLPGALVDLVHRQAVRLFTGSDEILAARIDLDAARLRLGRKIGDVDKLARFGRHREQGDLVAGALGRIQEFAVGRDLDISRPDFWFVVLRCSRRGRRCGAGRRLRYAPNEAGLRRYRA